MKKAARCQLTLHFLTQMSFRRGPELFLPKKSFKSVLGNYDFDQNSMISTRTLFTKEKF